MSKTKSKEEICQALAENLMAYIDLIAGEQKQEVQGPVLYSTDDLANLLGISRYTARQWVCQGKFGEPIHAGRFLRVSQEALDNYLDENTGPTKKRETKPRRPRAVMTPLGPAERI